MLQIMRRAMCGLLPAMLLAAPAWGQHDTPGNVITLDYAIAETLQALGEPPEALGGLSGYRVWWRDPQALPAVVELGSRHLPNLELIQDIAPSHILISPPAHANLVPQLSRLAALKEWTIYQQGTPLSERLDGLTEQLGELAGVRSHADEYLQGVRAQLEILATHFQNHDQATQPLVLVSLMDERHARVFGQGSLENLVLEQLGLRNGWDGEVNRWGFATVTAGQLFELEGRVMLLESPYSAAGTQQTLLERGIWQYWPAVTRQEATTLSVAYWHWGGWPSALRFATSLVEALGPHEMP
ncbi:ABC transporter substrate-binding protein [Vreelandella hamiltonii]|uniref:ABC transporter substrate-binding protein n=1 Tax=Vreelandella hamiltonii TaxID=502829 RepID=A0A8H9I3I8_9GAMM|nr:ABC transporter substrate-binding protein [Halomonas hamiltonii]GGW32324.1 ABC transporter substrate-binding protein [Halomonas hamiltonii]